jgi:ribonucleotide reductase beta subunit family protein with ferritin-like domain
LSFIPLPVLPFLSLAEKKGYYHLLNYFKVLSMTAIELITKEDLKQFKSELLAEIKQIIKPGAGESKQWLKSVEVRKMLSISPGTLQTLRINGTLRFTKVGGMMYYKLEDIHKLLEGK